MNAFALHAAGVGPLGLALVFLAALAGALLVFRVRQPRYRGALPTPREALQPLPPAAPGLPDWSHADSPLLDLVALETVVRAAAGKAGIDPGTLPTFGPPEGTEGSFVFRDKFDYIYAYYEHGVPMSEFPSAVADQLAYRVVADRAWLKAYLATANQGLPEAGRTAKVAAEQERMLALADPAWARKAAWERTVKDVA